MDTDFAITCPLVRRHRPQIQFLSIGPYLLHASFRPHLTVVPMRFATLHLHQVGTGLSPASCRTCTAYKEEAGTSAGLLFLYFLNVLYFLYFVSQQ